VVCNSSKIEWKGGGGWQGGAAAELLTEIFKNVCKNVIIDVMSKVQNDSETFLQK
jgi:hypothetical protein